MDVHYDDEVLAHYGRKGMRWKIRRNNPPVEVSDVVRSNRQSPALKSKVQQGSIVPNRQSPKTKVQQDSIVASARRAGNSRMAVQRDKIIANKRSEKILANLERLRKKA